MPIRGADVGALLAVATAVLLCSLLLPAQMLVDEYVHWPQVLRFARHEWTFDPWIATWPTMNFIVALPLSLFTSRELWEGRAVISAFALVASIGYLKLVRELSDDGRDQELLALRTTQFMTTPVVLLFTCLVYTDIPALAALIWAAYGVVSRRRIILVIAATATVAFRQSHIVWFAALIAWYAYEVCKTRLLYESQPALSEISRLRTFAAVIQALKSEWPVWIAAFVVVVVWLAVVRSTGGVAHGAQTQAGHYVHLGGVPNVCFAFVVALIVFCPVLLAALLSRSSQASHIPPIAVLATIALVAVVFQSETPGNAHPAVQMFLRNRLLANLHSPIGHTIMTAACAAGLFACVMMPLTSRARALRWPLLIFGALYLLPFELVEQRYYLPMFALIWAMRAPERPAIEWLQLAWGIFLSAIVLFQVVVNQRFL